LLTHYAKGTLSLLISFSLELLIKLLFQIFPSRYFFAVACISYLALEKGFPTFKQNIFHFTLKAFLYQFLIDIESHLIFIPEANKIFQFTSFDTGFFQGLIGQSLTSFTYDIQLLLP
jgi:hypothetical protein